MTILDVSVDAVIVTRGRRSLGYGFVTYATEAEAIKAAQELNNKSLDGREINVEVARTKPTSESDAPKSSRRQKKKKASSSSSSSSSDESEKVRSSKEKKKKVSRATEPSKTTLFVANLPYATTDDDLKKLFAAYKINSAHVARMRNGRSKGYGFVEFESEQEQLKAFESVKDVHLEGRAIYLKIALSEPNSSSSSSSSSSDDEASKKEKSDHKKVKKASKKEKAKKEEAKTENIKKDVKKVAKKEGVEKENVKKEDVKKVAERKVDEKKDEKKAKSKKSPTKKAVESVVGKLETKVEALKINDTK